MPRPLLLLLLAACAPKEPRALADVASRLDYADVPRLPTPESGTYATGEADVQDPVLRPLLRGKHVDVALMSAAGGLALAAAEGKGDANRWELREALWRGGWPYPADEARAWTLGAGAAVPRDLVAWVEAVPADVPMALVRARGAERDVWVGIEAQPAFDLGPVPRVAALGSPVRLPAVEGAVWRVADQTGALHEGRPGEGLTAVLAGAGEWLFELRRDRTELARFPIFVAMAPPPTPLLRLAEPPPPITDSADADALAAELLDHVRATYACRPWKRSPIFDAAVGRYVDDPSIGSAGALRALGFPEADAIVWACDEATVESCVDTWMWDPRRRSVLLTDRMDSYGLHATLDGTGVHLTLLLVDAG